MSAIPSSASPEPSRRRRWMLAGCAAVLGAAALVVGINDNPPGLLLLLLSSIAAILALLPRWRTAMSYLKFSLFSALAFLVAAVLHNLLEVAAHATSRIPALSAVAGGVGVAFFLVAIFLCPAGIVVGFIAYLVMKLRGKATPSGAAASG